MLIENILMSLMHVTINCLLVFCAIKMWIFLQKCICQFETPKTGDLFTDYTHENSLVTYVNEFLQKHKTFTRYYIAFTTFLFDFTFCISFFEIIIFGNMKVFLVTMSIIILRFICQCLVRLPTPKNMIWFDPKIPTLLMVYETENDFFFSGHTAFSLTWGLNLFLWNSMILKIYSIFFILLEISFVVFTKSHYYIDIYTGIVTYLGCMYVASFFW